MGRSLNKIMLIGNAGNAPEFRSTAGGHHVAHVSLATSFRLANGEDKVQWHRLVFWDGLAEVVERYVNKGSRIYVEGRVEYGQYTATDGSTRYTTDIVCTEMVLLGDPNGNGEG